MKIKFKKIKQAVRQLEHVHPRKKIILYLSTFILALLFGSLVAGLVKVNKINSLLTRRQQFKKEQQQRLDALFSRFEAQAISQANPAH